MWAKKTNLVNRAKNVLWKWINGLALAGSTAWKAIAWGKAMKVMPMAKKAPKMWAKKAAKKTKLVNRAKNVLWKWINGLGLAGSTAWKAIAWGKTMKDMKKPKKFNSATLKKIKNSNK